MKLRVSGLGADWLGRPGSRSCAGRPRRAECSVDMTGSHPSAHGSYLGPEDGLSLDFGFSSLRVLLRAEDTGGAFGLTEQPLEPGALAGPLHTHANEIGFFYVLEGQIGVQVGEQVIEAGPRSTVSVPAGLRHTFWNPATVPARVLEFFAPGGFERWFEELAGLIADGNADIDTIAESARPFGTEMAFESLPDLLERHSLHFPS